MNTFKIADIIIRIILIILFVSLTCKNCNHIFTGYFVVAGRQLIRMLIHLFTGSFTQPGTATFTYHRVTPVIGSFAAALLTAALLNLPVGGGITVFLCIMLFVAPAMAVYYTLLCIREYRILRHRELIQLR